MMCITNLLDALQIHKRNDILYSSQYKYMLIDNLGGRTVGCMRRSRVQISVGPILGNELFKIVSVVGVLRSV